ncbi:MAG: recombination protein O N-terminal domain-containing protein [Candidatus Paceibacterota bacterium]|jgi:hypothetical protein
MHNIYTTSGFVIGSSLYGEADKMLFVFTRDFGLVNVIAKGIRLGKSKLRFCVQDYSLGIYSLVRGRDIWRLTDARELVSSSADKLPSPKERSLIVSVAPVAGGDPPVAERLSRIRRMAEERNEGISSRRGGSDRHINATNDLVFGLIVRIALLLRRFLHGEEKHEELFDCILKFMEFCMINKISEKKIDVLESLIVARILYLLGYIGDQKGLNEYLKSIEINDELLNLLQDKRIVLNREINKALSESHL